MDVVAGGYSAWNLLRFLLRDRLRFRKVAGTTGEYVSGSAVAVSLTDGTNGNTYGGSAIVTSVSVEVSSADLVTVSLDLTGTGELTIT